MPAEQLAPALPVIAVAPAPEPAPAGQLRLTVARTADEVEAMRSQFDRLPPANMDADLDFLMTVVRSREAVLHPHVILLELPDGRELRITARVERQRAPFGLGRSVRLLNVAFGGVTGIETAADAELVVGTVRRALADGAADIAVLPQLERDGLLCAAAAAGAPWWLIDHVPAEGVHWWADVPDSLEAFMAQRSSKTRYAARRYSKKLVEAHGTELSVREFRRPDELEALCADLESVAAKTYQRGLGVGYMGDPMQLALMSLAADQDWLRAWVLYVAGVPVAFWFGFVYRGTFSLIATSFDPAHGELRVGQHLQMEMMASLCADPDVQSFDYGAGDAEYKRRFGDRCVAETGAHLFAGSPMGLWLNLTQTGRTAARRAVKAWVARSELGARAKKAWRGRAQRRAGAGTGSAG